MSSARSRQRRKQEDQDLACRCRALEVLNVSLDKILTRQLMKISNDEFVPLQEEIMRLNEERKVLEQRCRRLRQEV